MLVRVDEDILLRAGVSDEVVQAAAVIGKSVELFHRDAALIFDHALKATINVPSAGYDTAAELVLGSDDEFVRILHTRAGGKRFAAVYGDVRLPLIASMAWFRRCAESGTKRFA